MVSAAAAVLAAALLCAPGSGAAGRFAALRGTGQEWRGSLRAPGTIWLLTLAAGVGFTAAGVGGGTATMLVTWVWRRRRGHRLDERAGATAAGELADALARICDELRAGAHPAAALAGAEDDGPRARAVLGPAATAARLGDDVPPALVRAGSHPAVVRDVRRIAAAWALADRHGVPLAELLGGVLTDLRWRSGFANRLRAELAGPRATATVLTALPLLGLGLGQLLGAHPLAVLRSGVPGQVLLVVGVGLAAVGVLWTEHILRAAVPR